MGMFYQWGRKDPFTFATSSELWGSDYRSGKYPVKIYTIDGVLIYQVDKGGSNKDKKPVGGILESSNPATSMMEIIKNPITFYGNLYNSIVSQIGQTRDLWDYYWASYSRGTDGYSSTVIYRNRHNDYLDSFISQKIKSIYDPCHRKSGN